MAAKITIAIDGPAGSGKSSTARAVAKELAYKYIDTGAMYRAMALHILDSGVDPENEEALRPVIDGAVIDLGSRADEPAVTLNGRDVSGEIRTPRITAASSPLSQIKRVRTKLISEQQRLGAGGGAVLEGRDIGTVVFPNAELKIFMTASVEERAMRRFKELEAKGTPPDLEQLTRDIRERDERDSSRAESPLVQAPDAVLLDTTGMTLERQIDEIVRLAREKEKRS